MKKYVLLTILLSFLLSNTAEADGTLSDNMRIESTVLGYDLQYRVFVPEGLQPDDKVPTIYIVDGQWYISNGRMHKVLNYEIKAGNIKPVIAIFIDSRDPDNLNRNLGKKQFFCNKNFVTFFKKDLVPEITKSYPVSDNREDRVILGVSFGAYNSACFGLMANDVFKGIAMHSPSNSMAVYKMANVYKEVEKQDIKIFMSVGTKRDNGLAGRKFKRTLIAKGYDLTYIEVPFSHNWNNWRPLIDDVLVTFFGSS